MSEELINLSKSNAILMFNIINACAKRGAFQPEEFKVIGTLHDALKTELKIEDPKTEDTKPEEVETN